MKKIFLVAFLFCLTSPIANAQVIETKKPVVCAPMQQLVKELQEEKEIPLWAGEQPGGDSGYMLFVNEKTQSWTFIQFDGKMACILGMGIKSKIHFKGV